MISSSRAIRLAAVAGAALITASPTLAKGPFEVDAATPLILVKEGATRIDITEFPWALEDGRTEPLEINVKDDIILLPWVEVERDGDDEITVSMPERIMVTKRKSDDSVLTQGVLESEAWVMTFARGSDEQISAYNASADMFSLTIATPDTAAPIDARDVKITVTGLRVNSEFDGFVAMMEQAGGDADPVEVFRTLDLLFEFEMDSLTVDGDIPRENGSKERVVFQAKTGAASFDLSGGDSRINMATAIEDFDLAIAEPMPLNVGYGTVAFEFGLPTEASPDPQDIRYVVKVEDVNVSEQLWMLVDPGKQLPRKLNRAVIDLDMTAIFKESLFDRAARGEIGAGPNKVPFQPATVTVNEIAFDALGFKVDAKGDIDIMGSNPAGKGFVSVKGLTEFLASLKKRRFIVDAQAIMIEGMARQMGKEGPDGALTYDIKTTDSMLVINDNPIAPLPPMPPK